MQKNAFFKLGQRIHRFRIPVILIWMVILLACLPHLPSIMSPFSTTGFIDERSDSAKANRFLEKQLGDQSNRFIILYHSDRFTTDNPTFLHQIKRSLSKLKTVPIEHQIIYPTEQNKQISKDKHAAYALILFKNQPKKIGDVVDDLKANIKPPQHMTMRFGGEPIFIKNINQQTQQDLYQADAVVAPVSVMILILVFGSIIAALVPMCLGGGCALIILTSLYFIAQLSSLSIFTMNIALLLGLCLGLDYALFMIYRFREELNDHRHKTVEAAIAKTCATAGKAVFFSGLAVFISLSALLFFPINILFSVGVGGLTAVFVAVMLATTLLPAILSVLGHRINQLSLWKIRPVRTQYHSFWKSFATTIVRRPWIFFITTLSLLLCLGYPFLNARFGISDFKILPDHSESRQFFQLYEKQFNPNELTPIFMLVTTDKGSILSKKNLAKLIRLNKKLEHNDAIEKIESIVSTKPKLSLNAYHNLYHLPKEKMDRAVQQLLEMTTRKQVTMITIVSRYPANSAHTKALVRSLRTMHPEKGLQLQLTGVPVNNLDVFDRIAHIFPYAVAWIMALTYLVLMILLRSLFLPLKAIIMNMLSLSASYGILVYVFQEGHFQALLNFQAQGMLDISLLIIIFCALFGFSMDYEVFLLTRIQEYYLRTQDNDKSIVFGIVKSSRIITSAAIIVIFICGSFMVADVLMVKEFGLGIAAAIFVDAFIIRTVLVPSTMALVKKWNWYLPFGRR